jgi:hypothetical protein
MGLVFRGSLRRRWSQKASVVICGLALSVLPAWAQGLPQPPINSDIAFRIMPAKDDSLQMSTEVLHEQPLVRLLSEAASSYFGFDMVDDLGRAFDGTVVGAVLSDAKKGSSLAAVFADQELRSQRELVVSELRALASDLESYKVENESYPEDFRKFIDEYRYYEPSLPEGVTYDYQPTNQGQGFRLVAIFAAPSELGELGPAPIFTADYGEEHALPERPAPPLNFVLGARVGDAQLAKQVAAQLMGEPKNGFWTSSDDPPMVATLRGPWLVVANNKANLSLLLKSLNGQTPGLSKNPGYQLVAKNIDMDAAGMMYVDLPKILKSIPLAENPDQQSMLDLLGPTGYAITPYERSQLRVEVFMGVKPPKDSELAAVFAGTAQAQTESALVAANIPWDVSNAFAMDYQLSKRLFDAVVALSDDAKQTMETVEDVWAGFLGLDAEAGFNHLVDGWVVVSFERLDIFVNAFEGFVEEMNAMPELPPDLDGTGGPQDGDVPPVFDEDGNLIEPEAEGAEAEAVEVETVEAEVTQESPGSPDSAPTVDVEVEIDVDVDVEETEPPAPAKPPRLPFTVAFQVKDQQARSALLDALVKQLGEQTKTTTMSGVEVLGRQDGLLSYAMRDNWFYISGGNTQRLLRNLLAAATGRKATLTSLDTWARFRAGQKGEVLAIGHQKVDAFYSMVKGALLFMGPDFRPLAEELGGLRDYHSAAFLVPDGLLIVGDVLQGETK